MSENKLSDHEFRDMVASEIGNLLKSSDMERDDLAALVQSRNKELPIKVIKRFVNDVIFSEDWISNGSYSKDLRYYMLSLMLDSMDVPEDDHLISVIDEEYRKTAAEKWEGFRYRPPELYKAREAHKDISSQDSLKIKLSYSDEHLIGKITPQIFYSEKHEENKKNRKIISEVFDERLKATGISQRTLAKVVNKLSEIPIYQLENYICQFRLKGFNSFPKGEDNDSVTYKRLAGSYQVLGVPKESDVILQLKKRHRHFVYPIDDFGPIGFHNYPQAKEIFESLSPGLEDIQKDALDCLVLNKPYNDKQES